MNIYAGNLSYSVTEEDLQGAFEAFGAVTSVNLIKDRFTGESKGFGFVEMASKEEAKVAIESLNGKDIKGKSIIVNEARPKTNDRGGGGGGRRDNRGGGGGGGRRGGSGGGGGYSGGGGGGGGRRW
jgi:RNA recognition motif-containing protein